MTSRRIVLLEAIEAWRDEGILTDAQYDALRARYATPPPGGDEEEESREALGAHGERAPFAANALQLVGGLLLGAGLVALTFFLDVEGDAQAWTLLGFGAIGVAAGVALRLLAPGRDGMEQALLAAGLVPVAISAFPAQDLGRLVGLLGAAASVGAYLLRRGNGPVVVLAGAAYVATTFGAVGPELLGSAELSPYAWWLALLAFGGALLAFRREGWTTAALGLYVAPLTFAFLMVATEAWGVQDGTQLQLLAAVYLGAILALGIWLGNRGLVAGAAAGLTIDAVVFAADLGGAGSAVVVLLALGGALVWQAEFLRAYFRRSRAPASGKR